MVYGTWKTTSAGRMDLILGDSDGSHGMADSRRSRPVAESTTPGPRSARNQHGRAALRLDISRGLTICPAQQCESKTHRADDCRRQSGARRKNRQRHLASILI